MKNKQTTPAAILASLEADLDLNPTVFLIRDMALEMRTRADTLDSLADQLEQRDVTLREAASLAGDHLRSLNLRFDLLASTPLREYERAAIRRIQALLQIAKTPPAGPQD